MQSSLPAKLDMIAMVYMPDVPRALLQHRTKILEAKAAQRDVVYSCWVVITRPAPKGRKRLSKHLRNLLGKMRTGETPHLCFHIGVQK
jgi:hypothetical protein